MNPRRPTDGPAAARVGSANAAGPAGSPWATLGLMTAATALIAATSVMAKAVGRGVGGPELHPLQISAGRFLFGAAFLSPWLALRWPGLGDLPLGRHLGRVLCGWGGGAFLFAAATRLPLGDANAISFLAPVVTMALSIPLLGERVSRGRWAAAGLSMTGALVLAAPGTSAFRPAAGLALAAALLMGAELVFIKHLASFEPPTRILAMSNLLGLAIALPVSLPVWRGPGAGQWALLALLGGCMATAQALFVQANRRSDASWLAPVFYTASLFAAVYDRVFFGQPIRPRSAAGIALIVAGAVALTRQAGGGASAPPSRSTGVR